MTSWPPAQNTPSPPVCLHCDGAITPKLNEIVLRVNGYVGRPVGAVREHAASVILRIWGFETHWQPLAATWCRPATHQLSKRKVLDRSLYIPESRPRWLHARIMCLAFARTEYRFFKPWYALPLYCYYTSSFFRFCVGNPRNRGPPKAPHARLSPAPMAPVHLSCRTNAGCGDLGPAKATSRRAGDAWRGPGTSTVGIRRCSHLVLLGLVAAATTHLATALLLDMNDRDSDGVPNGYARG